MASKGRSLAKFVSATGISTIVDLNATRVNITGVSTVVDLNVTRANITGVTTAVDLNATRVNSSGIGTFGGVLVSSGSSIGIGTDNAEYPLHVIGSTYAEGVTISRGANFAGAPGGTSEVTIGKSTEENFALLDFVGDSTYNDFGLRIMRGNGGANTYSVIQHQGTGDLQINALGAAPILLKTSNTERVRISAGGSFGIGNFSSSAIDCKLTVGTGDGGGGGIVKINTGDQNTAGLLISNWDGASTSYGPSIVLDNSGQGVWEINSGDAADRFSIRDLDPDYESFRIDSNGTTIFHKNELALETHRTNVNQGTSTGTNYLSLGWSNHRARTLEVNKLSANVSETNIYSEYGFNVNHKCASFRRDNIIFFTEAAEQARISADGIAFNGDTAAANSLNDYEEGSWTPAFGVESGSPSWTYTSRTGLYIKIGRFIYVYMDLIWSARSGTGNILTIDGFPYAPSAGGWTGVVTDAYGVSFNNWGGATGQTQLALQTYSGGRMTTSAFSSGSTTTDTRGNWSMLTTGSGQFKAVAFAYV
jgi:hypothetical protein